MGRILIVDDEPHTRRVLALNLQQDGHEVSECAGVQAARKVLMAKDFDVVLTDQKMPDGDGLQVLAAAIEADPAVSVVVITAFATVDLAVESMRQGAFDFITKPFQPEVVRAAVSRACERTRLRRENVLLKDTVVRLEGSAGDPWLKRGDASGARIDRAGRSDRRHGPDHRRNRHRQGTGGSRHP